ncbi:hypothetical protein MKW92_023018 [Papaver armeniacum]|nr:hypothetical protein MKW92_023018 [Papaver armeniacum]
MISLNVDSAVTSSGSDGIVPAKSPALIAARNFFSSAGQQTSHEITDLDELEYLKSCRDAGVVHILGNTIVRARRDAKFLKKISIDYIYAFLKRVCRENSVIFHVPHESLLNVGQIFYV